MKNEDSSGGDPSSWYSFCRLSYLLTLYSFSFNIKFTLSKKNKMSLRILSCKYWVYIGFKHHPWAWTCLPVYAEAQACSCEHSHFASVIVSMSKCMAVGMKLGIKLSTVMWMFVRTSKSLCDKERGFCMIFPRKRGNPSPPTFRREKEMQVASFVALHKPTLKTGIKPVSRIRRKWFRFRSLQRILEQPRTSAGSL